jgi:hypothetical protein
MAVGDQAAADGFPIVPDSDPAKNGALEINRTRDFVAQVLNLIPEIWPVTKGGTGGGTPAAARTGIGISSGTDDPSDDNGGTVDGNIYFKIMPTS